MNGQEGQPDARLLVVSDLKRLGPIVAECFAPQRVEGVQSYLEAVAEIPRQPTRAVLVAHDPTCRNPQAALAAMKHVAGEIPVVYCCEPAYEVLGRKLLDSGIDDYVIFPPQPLDLERALGIPTRTTHQRWVETPVIVPTPSVDELARLAALLPMVLEKSAGALDAMAALVCSAMDALGVVIVLEGRTGAAGRTGRIDFEAVLVEPLGEGEKRIGQIRVGPPRSVSYTHEHTAKLRHYGVLLTRLIETTHRASQWRQLSLTDDLTGLPNRRHLLEFLDKTLESAARSLATVTALVFDIDDFKRFNDTYGHDAGDEILRDVAKLFLKCSRKTDMVARYGGDEFVVVFWNPEGPRNVGSQHPAAVMAVVERFRAELKSHSFPRLGPEAVGCLTISGGLAHYPWQAKTGAELIAAADRALLHAKEAGKNRFWVVGSADE